MQRERERFLIVISPLFSFTLSQMLVPWGIQADRPRIINSWHLNSTVQLIMIHNHYTQSCWHLL